MSSPKETWIRHPKLYFPTGDIILRAPIKLLSDTESDKTKYRLFRVHKTILGFHSVAFFNLFADATGGTGPTYDELPMVELPDKARDLAALLDCIYKPSYSLPVGPNLKYVVAHNLAAVTRLADKYMLESLRDGLIQRVVADWPTSLFEWDIREAETEAFMNVARDSIVLPDMESMEDADYSGRLPEPASAIMFAQEYGCPEILPAAFYTLYRIPVDADRDDESGYIYELGASAKWKCLDAPTLLQYMRGCEQLRVFRARMGKELDSGSMFNSNTHPCRGHTAAPENTGHDANGIACLQVVKKWRAALWEMSYGPSPDPLRELLDLSKLNSINPPPRLAWAVSSSLCLTCSWEFRSWINERRDYLWQSVIPHAFGLDPQEEEES
ncbi:hypothetical protein C2E23DRAFT_890465 [Lenzites betulinus]|nr:hypothetical protein C2E23DRAFT_890465 [Lenzites betulinus]